MPMEKLNVQMRMPFFQSHTVAAGGYLTNDREDHALWWYYITATANVIKVRDTLVYEGERDIEPNYAQLFQHAAMFYGVDINLLANRWERIYQEMERTNMLRRLSDPDAPPYQKLPAEFEFRNTQVTIQ